MTKTRGLKSADMSALDDDCIQGQLVRTPSGRWSIGDRL